MRSLIGNFASDITPIENPNHSGRAVQRGYRAGRHSFNRGVQRCVDIQYRDNVLQVGSYHASFAAEKKGSEKIVCLTAYTAPIVELLDPHCYILPVGDSLGMVLRGLPTTVDVTLEMMIFPGQAVMRGSTRAMVAIDLPFGSYESSPEQAFDAASRNLVETGAQAVKIEAADGVAESIAFRTGRGIPVIGHVGLRPQAVHLEGGFRAWGRTSEERERVLAEARATDEPGAVAIVVEGVTPELAIELTQSVRCPTIVIGASNAGDGQILVAEDMLGLVDWTPKFGRKYADLRASVLEAVSAFAADVRSGAFSAEAEAYRHKGRL